MEDWELDAFEMLAPLREVTLDPADDGAVVERSLDRVKDSIGASDFVELATTVLVAEFLGPVLDLFAFALGLEKEDPDSPQD